MSVAETGSGLANNLMQYTLSGQMGMDVIKGAGGVLKYFYTHPLIAGTIAVVIILVVGLILFELFRKYEAGMHDTAFNIFLHVGIVIIMLVVLIVVDIGDKVNIFAGIFGE